MNESPSSASDPAGRGAPTGMTAVFATGRFVAELGLLAGLAVAGWATGGDAAGTWLAVVLVVLLPLVAAAVWGAWVAPRARRRLADPGRLGVEVLLFGAACALLLAIGMRGWAAALGLLWIATAFVGRSGY